MNEPIKLYMISGFLGSGKTTFLRRLLQEAKDERVGVIVNEFGSVGIDGRLIRGGDVKLVEINNGSIFCSCLKDGFVRTLKAFSEQPIQTLVIENSGLADPSGMQGILNGLTPYLKRPYAYQGEICLVDCTSFLDYYEVLLPVQNQIAAADVIIVNKTDLADASALIEIHAVLKKANPEAAVLDAEYAAVSVSALRAGITNRASGKAGTAASFVRPYTRTIVCREAQSADAVERLLEELSPVSARIKGFLQRAGGGLLYADAAGGHSSVEPADPQNEDAAGKLVLIGRSAEDIDAEIRTAWRDCCRGEMTLEE